MVRLEDRDHVLVDELSSYILSCAKTKCEEKIKELC